MLIYFELVLYFIYINHHFTILIIKFISKNDPLNNQYLFIFNLNHLFCNNHIHFAKFLIVLIIILQFI